MLIKVIVDEDRLNDLETLEKTLGGLFLQAQILPDGKAEVICRVTKSPEKSEGPEVIDQLTIDLDANKNAIRSSESSLSNLVADAKLAHAKKIDPDVIVAITNTGEIRFDEENRSDGTYKVGDFTQDMAAESLPFGKTVAILEITGAQLKELIEQRAPALPEAIGFFAQVSAGAVYTVDTSQQSEVLDADSENPTIETPGERVVSITINGVEIADTDIIKIALSEYIKAGEDGIVRNLPEEPTERTKKVTLVRMWNCADIVPEWECDLCDLPVASTYAQVLMQVAEDLELTTGRETIRVGIDTDCIKDLAIEQCPVCMAVGSVSIDGFLYQCKACGAMFFMLRGPS